MRLFNIGESQFVEENEYSITSVSPTYGTSDLTIAIDAVDSSPAGNHVVYYKKFIQQEVLTLSKEIAVDFWKDDKTGEEVVSLGQSPEGKMQVTFLNFQLADFKYFQVKANGLIACRFGFDVLTIDDLVQVGDNVVVTAPHFPFIDDIKILLNGEHVASCDSKYQTEWKTVKDRNMVFTTSAHPLYFKQPEQKIELSTR